MSQCSAAQCEAQSGSGSNSLQCWLMALALARFRPLQTSRAPPQASPAQPRHAAEKMGDEGRGEG